MELKFNGVPVADNDPDPRDFGFVLPGGTFVGGGTARSDYHFNDSLVSSVTSGGQQITPSFVRLGNLVPQEEIYIFMQPGITTGAQLDMNISATWNPSNFPYSALVPGTYFASYPRFGDAVVNIAPIPEPATWCLLTIGIAGLACTRRSLVG